MWRRSMSPPRSAYPAAALSVIGDRLAPVSESAKDRLLLIDGLSMAFRAFFALPVENFATSTGAPTNAVYGFTAMLASLLTERKPTHVAVCFDLPGGTFRTRRLPSYKGTRDATPPDFEPQVPLMREVLDALGVVAVDKPDYEADDLLAPYARMGREAGMEHLHARLAPHPRVRCEQVVGLVVRFVNGHHPERVKHLAHQGHLRLKVRRSRVAGALVRRQPACPESPPWQVKAHGDVRRLPFGQQRREHGRETIDSVGGSPRGRCEILHGKCEKRPESHRQSVDEKQSVLGRFAHRCQPISYDRQRSGRICRPRRAHRPPPHDRHARVRRERGGNNAGRGQHAALRHASRRRVGRTRGDGRIARGGCPCWPGKNRRRGGSEYHSSSGCEQGFCTCGGDRTTPWKDRRDLRHCHPR